MSGSWIPLGCRAGARLRVNARPRHRACTLMPRLLMLLSPSSLGNSLPPPLSPLLPLAVNEPGKAVVPPPYPPVPHTNTHLPHFLFTLLRTPSNTSTKLPSRTRLSRPKVLFLTSVQSRHLPFVLQTYFLLFLQFFSKLVSFFSPLMLCIIQHIRIDIQVHHERCLQFTVFALLLPVHDLHPFNFSPSIVNSITFHCGKALQWIR